MNQIPRGKQLPEKFQVAADRTACAGAARDFLQAPQWGIETPQSWDANVTVTFWVKH